MKRSWIKSHDDTARFCNNIFIDKKAKYNNTLCSSDYKFCYARLIRLSRWKYFKLHEACVVSN